MFKFILQNPRLVCVLVCRGDYGKVQEHFACVFFVKNRQMIKKHLFWLKYHMVYLWVLKQGSVNFTIVNIKIYLFSGDVIFYKKNKMTSMILVSNFWFSVLLLSTYGCLHMKISNLVPPRYIYIYIPHISCVFS